MWPFKKKDPLKEAPVLRSIRDVMFPPLEIHNVDNIDVYIDYAIDSNLEAILSDLQDGVINEATKASVRHCIKSVSRVRNLLQFSDNKLGKATHYVVANKGYDYTGEDIQVGKES
jgi:hypothetical protein